MKFPKIFEHFHQGQIFTIDEAKQKLNTHGNTLRKRLCELSRRGYLKPMRQGLYQLGVITTGEPIFPFDPFSIGAKLTPYGAMSFGTALCYHADPSLILPTFYIQSPSKFNNFHLQGVHFVWSHCADATGLFTVERELVGHPYPLLITNLERTLVDCLKKPFFAPHPAQMVAIARSLSTKPNIMKILQYSFLGEDVPPFFSRLGFLLESLQDTWSIPTDILEALKAKSNPRNTPWYHTRGRPSEIIFTDTKNPVTAYSLEGHHPLSQKWNLTFEGTPLQGA